MSEYTFEHVEKHLRNLGFEFDDQTIQLYTNMYNILSEFTHDKLTFDEIHEAYDFLGDVIVGERMDVLIEVREEDFIRSQVRLMEGIPQTAGKLTEEEKCRFAFCVYYTLMIEMYDEEDDEFYNGLHDFTSLDNIERLYQQDREIHCYRYILTDSDAKADTGEQFGFSPENPIPATTVSASYMYLESLRYNGEKISYSRIGSCVGIGGTIDEYRIESGNQEWIIYIDPYGSYNSKATPEGFTLVEFEMW